MSYVAGGRGSWGGEWEGIKLSTVRSDAAVSIVKLQVLDVFELSL